MRTAFVLTFLSLVFATECHASYITSVAANNNTAGSGIGSQVNGRLDSNNAGTQSRNTATPTLNMAVSVFAKHRPFDVRIQSFPFQVSGVIPTPVDATPQANAPVVRDYTVNLTVSNLFGNAPISPSQANILNDIIGSFDIELIGTPALGTNAAGSNIQFGTAPLGTHHGTVFANGKKIRFGGLNGGGLAIPKGGSQVLSFHLLMPTYGGNFSLRFTANPEPASLALGALALGPVGLFIRNRRNRNKKVVAAVA